MSLRFALPSRACQALPRSCLECHKQTACRTRKFGLAGQPGGGRGCEITQGPSLDGQRRRLAPLLPCHSDRRGISRTSESPNGNTCRHRRRSVLRCPVRSLGAPIKTTPVSGRARPLVETRTKNPAASVFIGVLVLPRRIDHLGIRMRSRSGWTSVDGVCRANHSLKTKSAAQSGLRSVQSGLPPTLSGTALCSKSR